MTTLPPEQLAVLARAAGWTGDDVITAVAVGLGESGGRSDAVGDLGLRTAKWGPSVGPWQIRSLNADKGTGRTRDEVANMAPMTNAKHAHEIWAQAGNSFRPWSTYVSGQYRLHLPRARQAVTNPQKTTTPWWAWLVPSPIVGVPLGAADTAVRNASEITSTLDAAKEALTYPAKVAAWLADPQNGVRIAKALVGGALVVVGAAIVLRPAAEKAAGAAVTVAAPEVRAARAAASKAAPSTPKTAPKA